MFRSPFAQWPPFYITAGLEELVLGRFFVTLIMARFLFIRSMSFSSGAYRSKVLISVGTKAVVSAAVAHATQRIIR